MALHSIQRVVLAMGVLFLFGLGLWALRHPERFSPALGLGALAAALAVVALAIRRNYRGQVR